MGKEIIELDLMLGKILEMMLLLDLYTILHYRDFWVLLQMILIRASEVHGQMLR
jgi:hypothetical protein